MTDFYAMIIAVVTSIAASSGFWAYIQKKGLNRTATDELLMGLAYDKITDLGLRYIERGWISQTELADFRRYLYDPYRTLGGNGVSEQIMNQITNLPIRAHFIIDDIREAKTRRQRQRDNFETN